MSTGAAITAVADDLRAALRGVRGVRVYADPGTLKDPPAAVVGPPVLRWESYTSAPSSATFTVYLVARADERAMPTLWDLLPAAAEAVDGVTDAVMRTAQPGTYSAGGAELPCYELTVDVGLH